MGEEEKRNGRERDGIGAGNEVGEWRRRDREALRYKENSQRLT